MCLQVSIRHLLKIQEFLYFYFFDNIVSIKIVLATTVEFLNSLKSIRIYKDLNILFYLENIPLFLKRIYGYPYSSSVLQNGIF